MRYQVKDNRIVGLKDDYWDDDKDQYLLYVYPEGDCDNPLNAKMMYSCLYGVVQCNGNVQDGDEFETEYGIYKVVGRIHLEGPGLH